MVFGVFLRAVRFWTPIAQEVLYVHMACVVRCTSIHFAKNQLCLRLIGLSPLALSHPRLLLQTSVRSSKRHYAFFNLLKARSRSFGSNEPNNMPIEDLLLLRFHISA